MLAAAAAVKVVSVLAGAEVAGLVGAEPAPAAAATMMMAGAEPAAVVAQSVMFEVLLLG